MQVFQVVRPAGIVTDIVQDVDEHFIALPVYLLQFDVNRGRLLKRQGIKKERALVKFLQQVPFLLPGHGRKLEEVANVKHLYATKRMKRLPPCVPQYGINSIQRIGPHHGHFIYHQQFQFLQQLTLAGIEAEVLQQAVLVIDLAIIRFPMALPRR
jgi:hypothetical protein